MSRLRKAAVAAIFAVALSQLGVTAHHVPVADASSDVEAFALFFAEYNAQYQGVIPTFIEYVYAQDAAEKSDLAKKVQTALLVTDEHLSGLDVRPCFAPFARLASELFDTLIRYFEVVQDDPAIAGALFDYGGSLVTAITASVTDTLTACAPSVTVNPAPVTA